MEVIIMKKLLLFLCCALSVAHTMNASTVTDAIDAALEKLETMCDELDRAYHSTDTAMERIDKGIKRIFNRTERAFNNIGTRIELKAEIAHDHQLVNRCERAFATATAVGLASAIAGCPLAPLFCAGAKVAGSVLVASYIKLYVDKAAYKGTEIF
jgi:hypothetical protein